MSKENVWFEEITKYLYKEYKSIFLKEIISYKKESIKKIFLGMEGVIIGHDIDNDTAEGTDTQYSLGIYTQKQLSKLDKETYKWPVNILEETESFWGPPDINELWSLEYEMNEKFEQFQHYTVLAYVAKCLLTDESIKPYLDKKVVVVLSIEHENEDNTPTFSAQIPEETIRNKVIDGFVSIEENKKLFLSLWAKKITGLGAKFLKQLGIVSLPEDDFYPNKDEISEVHNRAHAAQYRKEKEYRKAGKEINKKECNELSIKILEPYLIRLTPYKGEKKTKKIIDAIKTHLKACDRLASNYNELENYEKAEFWLRQCYEVFPSGTGTLKLCNRYSINNNFAELIKVGEHIISLKDTDSYFQQYAYEYLAHGYLLNGDTDKACETFKKVIDMFPEKKSYYEFRAKEILVKGKELELIGQKTEDKVLGFLNEI